MPESDPDGGTPDTDQRPTRRSAFGDPDASLIEQMGGIRGLVLSTIPILAFVPANALWGLTVAIWAALGVGTAMLLWSLIRRENPQPAISGFIGVAICVFIAWRTGSASGYFLYGIITQAVYGAVFVISALVRWPLVGVIWGFLDGRGTAWRRNKQARRWYTLATSLWAVLFAIRAVLQYALYLGDEVNWLGAARVGMGWPLALVAFAGTVWAVRRAMVHEEAAAAPADGAESVSDASLHSDETLTTNEILTTDDAPATDGVGSDTGAGSDAHTGSAGDHEPATEPRPAD